MPVKDEDCCRCVMQVSILGDIRYKCAENKCTNCGKYMHEKCKNTTCYTMRPIYVRVVKGCKVIRVKQQTVNDFFRIYHEVDLCER